MQSYLASQGEMLGDENYFTLLNAKP